MKKQEGSIELSRVERKKLKQKESISNRLRFSTKLLKAVYYVLAILEKLFNLL